MKCNHKTDRHCKSNITINWNYHSLPFLFLTKTNMLGLTVQSGDCSEIPMYWIRSEPATVHFMLFLSFFMFFFGWERGLLKWSRSYVKLSYKRLRIIWFILSKSVNISYLLCSSVYMLKMIISVSVHWDTAWVWISEP